MKLKVNDIIRVNGFVMLKGMNDNDKFKVAKITKEGFNNYYWFSKPKGEKLLFAHKASSINLSINSNNNNYIEVI